jgi:hypothetical protein
MHHRLGHRSVDSLLLGNSDNIWNDVTAPKRSAKHVKLRSPVVRHVIESIRTITLLHLVLW